MANSDPSSVSTKTCQPAGEPGISPEQRRKAGRNRKIIEVAAWFEVAVGISFLAALNVQAHALFGDMPDGRGVVFAHFAGIALIGLGIACLPSSGSLSQRNPVRGLCIFNAATAIFFAWVASGTSFRGYILWPIVVVHSMIAILLFPMVLHNNRN